MAERNFEDRPAVRERVPVLAGIVGPSSSGKTYSALRLATGMQSLTGGDIFLIDTEARRSLHYADRFKFRHVEFSSPFSPLDYLRAIEHCVKKGAGVVIVDSMSHEHEGPGGVLEWHDREMERLTKAWNVKPDKAQIPAWSEPKKARRRLINSILQLGLNAVLCFRAKEKIAIKGGKVIEMGWMPIAGEEFMYEQVIQALLLPGSGGVPTWDPERQGEKAMVKLPAQFVDLFKDPKPLDESTGKALALWGAGDAKAPSADEHRAVLVNLGAAASLDEVNAIVTTNKNVAWTPEQRAEIAKVIEVRRTTLKTEAAIKTAKGAGLSVAECSHPDGFAASDEGSERVCIHCGATEDQE